MSRGEITVTTTTMGGIAATLSSYSSGGMRFSNNGRSVLFVTSAATSGGRRLVMECAQEMDLGTLEVEDRWIILGAACSSEPYEIYAGPFRPSIYNQQSGTYAGQACFSVTSTASSESPYTYLSAAESSGLRFAVLTTP